MSFFTYVFGKGYTGGPDFNQLETFRFELEDAELSLTLPKSNLSLPRKEININLPFRSQDWFDENKIQAGSHLFVLILGQPWVYSGPFWKVANNPFGVLDVQFALERVHSDKFLDVDNLDTLADAIRWNYEWYYEIAEPGKYGQGSNREVRQEAEEEYSSRHPKIPEEKKLRDKEKTLENLLRELPTQFETRQFGDQKWLYYALNKEPNYPTHYYCQPLDEQYYIYVRFHYGIDFREYFHLWKADAEAAEHRIMGMIKLTYPNRLMGPEC
jgi:hypothetical protein